MQPDNNYSPQAPSPEPGVQPQALPSDSNWQPHHSAPPEPVADPRPTSKFDEPMPVVKVLSVRGVEYAMMTLALWVAATTLAWILLDLVNGSRSYNYLVVPSSALITSVPVFGWLFLRLRRAELKNPSLRFEPSKRRWTQSTQILAFIATLINVAVFVYQVLQHFGSGSHPSLVKSFGSMVVLLVIAGGLLVYYWIDEHRITKA